MSRPNKNTPTFFAGAMRTRKRGWFAGPILVLGLITCTTAAEDEDSSVTPKFGSETIGGDRPAQVIVPSSYDGIEPMPLFFLLHGYSANAEIQDSYFRLSNRVEKDGFFLVLPNGTLDQTGTTFWNAWAASSETVDDVGYLIGLLDEMEESWQIDASKVYFLGHSNGGYMSYRMACEHADRVTGILNFAGLSPYMVESNCKPSEPVSVLHVHGTLDDRVPYESMNGRPGAQEVAALWVDRNGCDPAASTAGEPLNNAASPSGTETTVENWQSGCLNGSSVSLWTMEAAGHTPFFNTNWSESVAYWLLAHEK